jgi:multiple sugar transport system permease protein
MKRRGVPHRLLLLAVLIVVTLTIISPILWLAINSLKTNVDALAIPPKLVFKPVFSNYPKVIIRNPDFLKDSLNSVVTMVISTIIVLVLGMPAAYILARFRFTGKTILAFIILATRMVPRVAIGIPTYMILMRAGLLDTYFAVIVSFVAYNLPFGLWLLIGFVQLLPRELEEAAIIDGASRMQAFLQMIVPLVLPGLAAVGILVMIVCWREFFMPLILTSHNAKTLSVLAGTFMTEYGIDWGQLSAFAIITFVPVIAIAFYAQKYLISGLTMGAVKE